MEFTEKEIQEIKTIFEEKETVEEEELENLKKLKTSSAVDSIALGKLFIQCYHYIKEYIYLLHDKEDKQKLDLEKKLNNYLNEFKIEDLRNTIEQYGEGAEFGSYYIGVKIKDIVNIQRNKLKDLVELFFKIFGED